MDAVQEVKARLNIEDVVSEYVQLKRSGRNFKGLSPWTNEKTPSFIVSPEKQIWHDFSSGKGGDAFGFVMEVEGLDFKGALEMLARKAGVDLEEFRGSKPSVRKEFKTRALEALDLAARFYQKQLTASQSALKYLLSERGFTKQTLLTWRIGYSPNTGYALTEFLTKKGFTTDEIRRAGLATSRAGRTGDMFRGRIMIPLADSRGQIIGFTARLLADEPDAPKYINTPQTVVYDKSRHAYGLDLAKESIRKSGFVVVVEGNLDVISSHQAGVNNVIATAGTAMTDRHLKELKRFTGDIRLCFDADSAGLAATERAIGLAQKVGVTLGIIAIKGAKDPDGLIKKDAQQWHRAVTKSEYAVDWLIDRYSSELDLTTALGKKSFTDTVLGVIRRLSDAVEQEHYLKKVAELTQTSFEAVKSKFDSEKSGMPVIRRKPKVQPGPVDRTEMENQKLQEHLLAMLLVQPKTRQLMDGFKAESFTEGPARIVFNFLKAHPNFKGEPQVAGELQGISDYVKIMTLQFEELYQSLPVDDLVEQAAQLKHRLIDRYVKTQKVELAAAMQATTDEKELQILIKKADKLNELIK